jgi:hypothetical protein
MLKLPPLPNGLMTRFMWPTMLGGGSKNGLCCSEHLIFAMVGRVPAPDPAQAPYSTRRQDGRTEEVDSAVSVVFKTEQPGHAPGGYRMGGDFSLSSATAQLPLTVALQPLVILN